jgi:hypothetical protein
MNRDKNENAYRIVNLEVTPITIEGEEPYWLWCLRVNKFQKLKKIP